MSLGAKEHLLSADHEIQAFARELSQQDGAAMKVLHPLPNFLFLNGEESKVLLKSKIPSSGSAKGIRDSAATDLHVYQPDLHSHCPTGSDQWKSV